jgi:sortase (surface protein transpeptidase)
MKTSLRAFAFFFILTVLAAAPVPVPNSAYAQTSTELRSRIAALLIRIQTLTAHLGSLTAKEAALSAAGSQPIGAGGAWSSQIPAPAATLVPVSAATAYSASSAKHPVRVIVPAIGLDVPIEHMGINAKGEMAVPDGSGGNVGWYKDGTVPGETGSAVLAAHVYAAFSRLKDAPVGSDVYIVNRDNSRLHFVVSEKRTYDLNNLSPEFLFGRADDERLNLITCAGNYVPATGTYDQRLVLYATLASA